MNSKLSSVPMARLKEGLINYIQPSLAPGSTCQSLDSWIVEFYAKNGWDTSDIPPDTILQVFMSLVEQHTGWEYNELVADDLWNLQRWTVLHRNVMVLARIDAISRTWAAYCFPVPGLLHEAETELWRTEGAKLDPKIAASFFHVPWVPYRV